MLVPLLMFASYMGQKAQLTEYQRGSWLYHACKGAVRYLDAAEPVKLPAEDGQGFDECTSYIGGYLDGLPPNYPICASEASYGTMVKVYVAYMDRNPKVLDQPRYIGLDLALKQNYPCKK